MNRLWATALTVLFLTPAFARLEERANPSALPHREQVAPGVHVAGFADRYRSANCGWVELGDSLLLVDLPRGIAAGEFVAQLNQATKRPARKLVLTHLDVGDETIVESLLDSGVQEVLTSTEVRKRLLAGSKKLQPGSVRAVTSKTSVGDEKAAADMLPLDGIVAGGGAILYLPQQKVLFSGPLVVNGPRTPLPGSNTRRWVSTLQQVETFAPAFVVPGFGSWGGPALLTRQRRFLTELRRQVGYAVAQGRGRDALKTEVRIPADYLVWMPYDTPTAEDLEHVYGELTVPVAPFDSRVPQKGEKRPHALVLIGDQPHEPGHIEEGLRPVFEATAVVPHFTVDVRALSAENLAKVQLLVILRDGLQRPRAGDDKANYIWMTPEQERAVVAFVEGGGGFLNLHNSMGLYPADGPYLKLVGGRYIGHGPLERFRVEVVDPDHPITRGVRDFSVADEQHTPPYDKDKVHLLLRNRSDDGKVRAAAGWAYEPGRGRLCHLANGHTREALLHPMYQLLMRNAVNWCLRREPEASRPR